MVVKFIRRSLMNNKMLAIGLVVVAIIALGFGGYKFFTNAPKAEQEVKCAKCGIVKAEVKVNETSVKCPKCGAAAQIFQKFTCESCSSKTGKKSRNRCNRS